MIWTSQIDDNLYILRLNPETSEETERICREIERALQGSIEEDSQMSGSGKTSKVLLTVTVTVILSILLNFQE